MFGSLAQAPYTLVCASQPLKAKAQEHILTIQIELWTFEAGNTLGSEPTHKQNSSQLAHQAGTWLWDLRLRSGEDSSSLPERPHQGRRYTILFLERPVVLPHPGLWMMLITESWLLCARRCAACGLSPCICTCDGGPASASEATEFLSQWLLPGHIMQCTTLGGGGHLLLSDNNPNFSKIPGTPGTKRDHEIF